MNLYVPHLHYYLGIVPTMEPTSPDSNGSDGGQVSKQVLKRPALKFNKKKIPIVPRLTEPSFSFKNLEAKHTMAEMTQFSQISNGEYRGEVCTSWRL